MKTIICLVIVIIVASCNKSKDDFGGRETIRGRAFLQDTFSGPGSKDPNGGQIVNIQYADADTFNSFLYSVKADNDGYFSFTNLNAKKNYFVFFETEKSDAVNTKNVFYGSALSGPDNTTLEVIATPNNKKQNALFVTSSDVFGGSLQHVNVYLYSSRVLCIADTANVDGTGSIYSLTSDDKGRVFKTNIGIDSIFVNAKGTYGSISLKSVLNKVKPLDSLVTPLSMELRQ